MPPDSSIVFNASFKKPKEFIAKAQISLQSIGESKDISLVGSDGLLCGFLRISLLPEGNAPIK